MSEEAAALTPAVEAPAPPQEPQVTIDVAVAETAATQDAALRKRRTPSPRTPKKTPAEGEDTESEPEKQLKKRAKTGKRGPGRKKKVAVEVDAGDEQQQAERMVAALSDDVKGRFGQIGWAKMGGYPYWPCIITDPRLLPRKLQETALKVLETKYLVFFYVSNNYAPVSFNKFEPWDDSKFNYREGYPEKDSKAPKRRVKLMAAIEVADKELKLPIEERADGLLKPEENVEAVKEEAPPAPVKRKPGRPPKNKTAATATQSKTPKKRGPKPKNQVNQADEKDGKGRLPVAAQEEEEDAERPTLSKEEIKAKVASRKTPKKKETDDGANAAGGSAKKAPKSTAKHGKSNGSAEIDSKRKKEIELVVPHKSVKSADIREMTEEAAKKKLNGPKSKTKDKGEYKVGDLASCASKMARLQAKESARNNDELVGIMQGFFKETLMYRSDVERSGLAAVIAMLRKNLSPTVAQTASALRKHMIQILNNDTEISHLGKKPHEDAEEHANKKRKAENGSMVKSEELQPKNEASAAPTESSDGKENLAAKEKVSSPPADASPTKTAVNVTSKDAAVNTQEKKTPEQTAEKEAATAAPSDAVVVKTDDMAVKTDNVAVKTDDVAVKSDNTADEAETVTDKPSASPTKAADKPTGDVANEKEDLFEAPENLDKNRQIFIDMLSKILDHKGSTRADLANEIDAALVERFKESNDDYLTQARIIIFGLKENAPMRERLYSGTLHCLELAYADDTFFKAAE